MGGRISERGRRGGERVCVSLGVSVEGEGLNKTTDHKKFTISRSFSRLLSFGGPIKCK